MVCVTSLAHTKATLQIVRIHINTAERIEIIFLLVVVVTTSRKGRGECEANPGAIDPNGVICFRMRHNVTRALRFPCAVDYRTDETQEGVMTIIRQSGKRRKVRSGMEGIEEKSLRMSDIAAKKTQDPKV